MRPEKLFITLVLILAIRGTTFAQNPSSSKAWRFHSINQAGLLEGEAGSSWQLQTVNGMSYKSWFAGVGLGLDYYRLRGVPLFLDLRKTFGHSRNKPFVYADGGVQFIWPTDKEKNISGLPANFSNGLYLDGGGGYQLQVGKRNAILMSIGYSYKTASAQSPAYYYLLVPMMSLYTSMPANPPANTYNYYLSRISIKLGWEF